MFLGLWTQDANVAEKAGPLLSLLMLGNLLNCMMWVPYQAQLAYGWTSLAVRVNTVAIVFIVPALLIAVPLYGAVSAAWIWVALNLGYIVVGAQLMFKRILTSEKYNWYLGDVFTPIAAVTAVTIVASAINPSTGNPWINLCFLIILFPVCLVGGAMAVYTVRFRGNRQPVAT